MPQRRSRTARHTTYNLASIDQTNRRSRYRYQTARLIYEDTPMSNPRHPRYMTKQEFYRQRAARDAVVRRNQEHSDRYYPETANRRYNTSRNTATRQTILPAAPERGATGERGPRGASVQGPRGVPGANGLDGNADFMLLEATNHPNVNYFGFTQTDYHVSGTFDMLASPTVTRSSKPVSGGHFYSIDMLFKPGVYRVTVNARVHSLGVVYFGFDIDGDGAIGVTNEEPVQIANQGITAAQSLTFIRTFRVPHVTNFHFAENSTSVDQTDLYNYVANYPQIKFERIGHIEESGTDQTLSVLSGYSVTDTRTIEGGIFWSTNVGNPPPAGYHPNDHPSNGGTNEWAVVEQAADSGSTALGWIHRIRRFI